ncbi:unnamed protein product [Tetraodon nigroviridis]|uniref:(spotted green pufferfish) hypothetical protein n=1 Tax=Tetraodon nigroviridis TaxID=99883 RepID=Q4RVP9_TETNG|nr:unnamed protein product [Tetraodon nigroviridis]
MNDQACGFWYDFNPSALSGRLAQELSIKGEFLPPLSSELDIFEAQEEGLIEQRVTDGPRGCCPISGPPRAQWVSPRCYWLRRVWERMQRGIHTNREHASRL